MKTKLLKSLIITLLGVLFVCQTCFADWTETKWWYGNKFLGGDKSALNWYFVYQQAYASGFLMGQELLPSAYFNTADSGKNIGIGIGGVTPDISDLFINWEDIECIYNYGFYNRYPAGWYDMSEDAWSGDTDVNLDIALEWSTPNPHYDQTAHYDEYHASAPVTVKCGSSDSCSDTECSATITLEYDYKIGDFASAGLKGRHLHVQGNTYTSEFGWGGNGDSVSGGESDMICPEQNEDISITRKYGTGATTNTMKAIKCWVKDPEIGTNLYYGEESSDGGSYIMPGGGSSPKDTVTNTTICSNMFDTGNMFQTTCLMYSQAIYSGTPGTAWKPVYINSGYSRVSNPIIVYTATNTGGHVDSDEHQYSLDVQSGQWDAQATTIRGLEATGVLEANGGDKDCVVNGGSAVYIKSSSEVDTADKLKVCFTGYIPIHNAKESSGDEGHTPYIWSDTDGRDKGDYNTFYGGDWEDNDTYPFSEVSAVIAAKKLKDKIKNNLAHTRIELYAAEGIYRQGEEDAFEAVAQCVKGVNRNDPNPSVLTSASGKSNGACGKFGSFKGTAGEGQGNLLHEDKKYTLITDYDDPDFSRTDTLTVTELTEYYHTFEFMVEPPTNSDNSVSYAYFYDYTPFAYDSLGTFEGQVNKSDMGRSLKSSGTKVKVTGNLKPDNNIDYDDLYDNIRNILKGFGGEKGEKWEQMERNTGWVTNHIYAADYGLGRSNRLRDSAHTYSNSKPTQKEGWFNEGFTNCGMLEFQFSFLLDFAGTEKIMVIDPALCGQATSHYDLHNWTDNDNDGEVDSNIKEPGAMKDKIRTLRFQTSDFSFYEDGSDGDPHISSDGRSEEYYVTTLKVSEDIWDMYYGMGAINTHELEVPIYFNYNTSFKSKLFYLDNSTVEDRGH